MESCSAEWYNYYLYYIAVMSLCPTNQYIFSDRNNKKKNFKEKQELTSGYIEIIQWNEFEQL